MRIVIAALLSLSPLAAAEAAEIDATSRIDTVTVFPTGAEVARVAKLKIDKGEHTLVFHELPAGAVQGSIRVEGRATGKLEIGSVDTRRLFIPRADGEAAQAERKRIEDEIDRLSDQKSLLEALVQASETQKSLITNLTQLPSRPAPASDGAARGEDWQAILALIASGSAEAQRSLVDAQVKVREADRAIDDLKKKLASLAPRREERTEVKVFVAAEMALEADVTVRYQVRNAIWTSLYDARLSTGAKTVPPKLEIKRWGSITQRTGESWDDVAITLSTTRPASGSSAPELKPMTVDFEPEYEPRPVAAPAPGRERALGRDATARPPEAAATEMDDRQALGAVAAQKEEVAERNADVVAAPFQALFVVPGRLTVPETGEAKRVKLLEETTEPQLSVKTAPKEDAKAYLYAKLVLPNGSPLLQGPVSLFRDGTYVGEGRLPVLSPGEEHDLGFGVDDLVRVRHALSEEKRGETGLITTSRTDSRNFRITVKNLHERAIGLTIYDQIPASQNQDIKVELNARTAPTEENVDDKRGVLTWESKLDPDQEQVLDFGYKVTWPSTKSIVYGR